VSLYDEKLFNEFIIPTLVYAFNFVYFEIRIVFIIWKSQAPQNENAYHLRNKFMKCYVVFCIYLINLDVLIVLCFVFVYDLFFMKTFLIVIVSATFIPQIYYNLVKRSRSRVYLSTVFIIALNKLFVPVYRYL
jgi:hypothetical protein